MKRKVFNFIKTPIALAFGSFCLAAIIGVSTINNQENNNQTLIESYSGDGKVSPKKAISANGFDTSSPYNLNADGNSISNYLENSVTLTQKNRNGNTQRVEVSAPYTLYSTETIQIGTLVTCSSGSNASDNRTNYNLQNLEYNDQPYITNTNNIVVQGYLGDAFVQNLDKTLTGNSASSSSKYYLQDLKIDITLVRGIDNYKIVFNDVYFTTGYNTSQSQSTSKHITTNAVTQTYDYYLHHDEVGHYKTVTDQESYLEYGSWSSWYDFSIDCNQDYGTSGSYFQYKGSTAISDLNGKTDLETTNISLNSIYSTVNYYMSGNNFNYIIKALGGGGGTTVTGQVRGRTKTYHAAVTHQEWVVDTAAYDEKVASDVTSYSGSYTYREVHTAGVAEVSHTDTTTVTTWGGNTTTTASVTKSFNLDENNPITETAYNKNVSSEYEWYESPTSGSGEVKSFNEYQTAYNHVRETIVNSIFSRQLVYNSTDLTNYLSPKNTYEFTDGFGTNVSKDYIYFYSQPSNMGNAYQVYIVPEYNESSSVKNSIKKLWAFQESETEAMNNFIDEQTAKFVHHKEIFTNYFPADNYTGQTVVTNELNYLSNLAIDDAYTVCIKQKELTDSSFVDGSQSSTSQYQTMYAYENNFVGVNPSNYSYGFKVGSYSDEDWKDIAVVSGSTAFVNFYEGAIISDDNTFSYVITQEELTAGTNKITFNSNDKMFVRITKDDVVQDVLTASTNYALKTNEYTTVENTVSPEYIFNEPGVYKIEMANTTGGSNNARTITIKIYDENDLYASVVATNYQLNLNINNPAPDKDHVYINGINIYEVDNRQDYLDSRYHVEAVNEQPTIDSHYTKLTQDDLGNGIAPSTDSANMQYTFNMPNASYENQFHKCYYIEITLQNYTKRYFAYWNYIQPDANNLSISLTNPDWEKNIGYEVGYIPTFSYAAGEHTDSPTELSKEYNYTVSNPNVIQIDKENQKIIAIGEGNCSVTFSLAHAIPEAEQTEDDILSVTLNFEITDLDALRKEILLPFTETEIELGETKEIGASVNPGSKSQEVSYSSSNNDVAVVENGTIVSVAPGEAIITVHSEDEEIADKYINVVVNDLTSIFGNTNQIGYVGDSISMEFVAYDDESVTSTSNNESVAVYNTNTNSINLLSEGIATLTFNYYGKVQTIDVLVLQNNIKNGIGIELGNTFTITYPNDDVSLNINDENVASVDGKTLTTLTSGNTSLTITPTNTNIPSTTIPLVVSSQETLINNVGKITFVNNEEEIISNVFDNSKLTITSSDESICFVDNTNNKFIFKNPGLVNLSINYLGEEQTIKFVVLEEWLKEDGDFALGETKTFTKIDGVTVSTSNEKITIEDGKVKAIDIGSSEITISLNDNSLLSHSIIETINKPESLCLNTDSIIYVGDSLKLNSTLSDISSLEVVVSKEDVLSYYSESLSFTALKEGYSQVRIDYFGEKTTFNIYVLQADLKEGYEVDLGTTKAITYPGTDLVFTSSESSIVSIVNGKIVAKGDGVAVLTVEAKNDSSVKKEISITVNAPSSICNNKNKIIKIGEEEIFDLLVAEPNSVQVDISNTKILSYDSQTKTIKGLEVGETEVTLTYFDQTQVIKYMVIENEINVPLLDNSGKTLEGEFNEETKETVIKQANSLKVEVPEGYTATLNGEIYNGEEISEEGEYVLRLSKTYKSDNYANEVTETLVYRVIILGSSNPTTETNVTENATNYGMEAVVLPIAIGGGVVVAGTTTLIIIKKRKVGSMKK